ncbi:MAG TPA: hypothetical protein VMG10_17535 [Gemmataceae bacterium]|nr:hypothetical protein [Gemmataceae bacterium]
MSSGVDREVLGDWNNFKGTRYHLVFVIWLLLKGRVKEVRFFEGNDLLATQTIVPPTVTAAASMPVISIEAPGATEDVWMQLKCTCAPWTRSNLLDENLLFNFICNSYASQRRGRTWKVQLVTEGEVRKNEIFEFVNNPAAFSSLQTKLDAIIAVVAARSRTGRGRRFWPTTRAFDAVAARPHELRRRCDGARAPRRQEGVGSDMHAASAIKVACFPEQLPAPPIEGK